MHVEKGKFGVRKLVCARDRGEKQSAADQQEPGSGRFQERSAGPRPGLWMLQETAPGKSVLQSIRTMRVLVSKAARFSQPLVPAFRIFL
jgi:hypothetical protein